MQAVLLHTEWDDRLKATSGMMRKQKQSVDMSRKKKNFISDNPELWVYLLCSITIAAPMAASTSFP